MRFLLTVNKLVGDFLFTISYSWLADQGFFEVFNLGKLTLFHLSDKYPSVFEIRYVGLAVMGVVFMAVSMTLPIKGIERK